VHAGVQMQLFDLPVRRMILFNPNAPGAEQE
jgi:hypothetical protein